MTNCLTCISSNSCTKCDNGTFLKFDHTICVANCLNSDSRFLNIFLTISINFTWYLLTEKNFIF